MEGTTLGVNAQESERHIGVEPFVDRVLARTTKLSFHQLLYLTIT